MNIEEAKRQMRNKYENIIESNMLSQDQEYDVKRMWNRLKNDHIFDVGHLLDFARNTGKYANFGTGTSLIIGVSSEPHDFYYITLVKDENNETQVEYQSAVGHYDVINDNLMMFTNQEIDKLCEDIRILYENWDDDHFLLMLFDPD